MEMATVVPVDHAAAKKVLSHCICDPDNKLTLILGHPGKNECGRFIAAGYDPIAAATFDGVCSTKCTNSPCNVGDIGAGTSTVRKAKGKLKPQAQGEAQGQG